MAIYHLHVSNFSRLSGHSATARYRALVRQAHEDADADALLFNESGNLPLWAEGDAARFWQAVQRFERANGRFGTEVRVALPRELTTDAHILLAQALKTDIVEDKHPYSLVVRDGRKDNPYVRLIFSARTLDGVPRDKKLFFKQANRRHPETDGTMKNLRFYQRDWLKHIRQRWATLANEVLERHGLDVRIDYRSLVEQGVADRLPGRHRGAVGRDLLRRGKRSEHLDAIQRDLCEEARLRRELADVEAELAGLEAG